jgi:excisionase family DNA binding protein
VTGDSGLGTGVSESFNPLTLLGLSEADSVRPTRLFSPFSEAFGPPVVQGKHRQATAVQFLTVREVATRLRVSPATVYALCAAGKLPHARISNSLRIALKDFEAFVRRKWKQ